MNPTTHNDCIETFTGIYIRPFDPDPDKFDIRDIAHALANKCRYTGHVARFFSVAEHSVLMALHFMNIGEYELAYDALMHDASEAYLPDVARPMKRHVPELMKIEDRMQRRLAERFGFRWPFHKEIHEADRACCMAEARVLMRSGGEGWQLRCEPLDVEIDCLTPEQAEEAFLAMYSTLFNALFVDENAGVTAE